MHDLDTFDLFDRNILDRRGTKHGGADFDAIDQHQNMIELGAAQKHRRILAWAAIVGDGQFRLPRSRSWSGCACRCSMSLRLMTVTELNVSVCAVRFAVTTTAGTSAALAEDKKD